MPYEELVKRLRYCAVSDNQCSECKYRGGSPDGSKMCIDLLMEDAADAIEELTGFVQEAERDRDEYRERLDKANDAIEELQQTAKHYKGCSDDWYKEACDYKAMLPRWIPVTERLPEKKPASYLCRTEGGYCKEVRWTNILYGLVESDNWGWSIFDVPQFSHVTHWMPLPPDPEPPKEET